MLTQAGGKTGKRIYIFCQDYGNLILFGLGENF